MTLVRQYAATSAVTDDHAHELQVVGISSSFGVRASAFDCLGASAAVLDRNGVIVDTNRAWRLFARLNDGRSDATGVGVNYLDVCDRAAISGATASAEVAAGLRKILAGERERIDVEYPCPSPTEDRWMLLQAAALPVSEGAGAVVFHVDVTARKQLTDRMVALAESDGLTGLPNRRAAVRYLDEQLRLARSTGHTVWVLFLDINQFKAVNDRFGHHVGDELLVKVGARARRALRDCDWLCRFGGDEFVVICPGLSRDDVEALADRLRTVMAAPFQIGDLEVFGRISVGAAESSPISTAESMLRSADAEMYVDKRAGRVAPRTVGVLSPQLVEPTRAGAALTSSNELILFVRADGTIEWASPACTRLLGVPEADIVGLKGMDFIHPDDQASAIEAFMSIPNTGDQVTTDFRVVDRDGRVRWIEEIATNLLDDPAVGFVVGNLRDVTERVEFLERIELDRRRLADAQAAARMGTFEIDLRTGAIARSDELCRIVGVPISSAGHSSVLDAVHTDDREKLLAMLGEAINGRDHGELEYRIVRPSGEVRWVLARGGRHTSPKADIVAGTMLDITDRRTAHDALEFQATHDWLTKLPNPARLHAQLGTTLAAAEPSSHVMVAVVGIDNFGHFNDTRGTIAGDELIRSIAKELSTQSEPGDLLGRIRGDEFVVARVNVAADFDPSGFGQSLNELLIESSLVGDIPWPSLLFSVGVTTSTAHDSPESLLADADSAMHEAKRNGGGCVVVFDDEARARATRRRSITTALPHALERNEMTVEYQPIVDLNSCATVGFEALLRWVHPTLGTISPDEYIPIAEANRMIVPIGSWVIDRALRDVAQWRLDPCAPADLWMAINLSAQQLGQEGLSDHLSEVIGRVGLPPEAVHLEITETVLMDRIDNGQSTIGKLQSLGVNISIDDFGTGYSSLSYLSRLAVDTVKIDRSFVNRLSDCSDGTTIARAIISLAGSLGLNTVAEGIETVEQLETLRGLGCTNGQGFLWSRSLAPGEALEWIRESSRARHGRLPRERAR